MKTKTSGIKKMSRITKMIKGEKKRRRKKKKKTKRKKRKKRINPDEYAFFQKIQMIASYLIYFFFHYKQLL
jgi:hypothetical protein